MPITLLDGILLVIMLISALLAMMRGFSREVLSIVSWVVAAAAALTFYKQVGELLRGNIGFFADNNPLIADGVAAAGVFIFVLIIVSYLTMLLADMIIDSRIGVLDRTLGFVFGAARGALLVIIGLMGFLWLAGEREPDWVANAKSKPALVSIGTSIQDALPEGLDKTLKDIISPPKDGDGEPGEADADQKA